MTPEQEKELDSTMSQEVHIDLSRFEPQAHEWIQRGNALSCRCHAGRGVFLPRGVNLVGIREGKPVLKKG